MKLKVKQIYGLLTGLFLLVGCGQAMAQQDLPLEVLAYADMVLYGGKILTADDSFTIAEAIAIRDGKFLAVENMDRILKMAGPKTRKIDLKGKSVVPGFIETHAHNWVGNIATNVPRRKGLKGKEEYGFDMPIDEPMFVFSTIEEGLETIKGIVDKAQPGKWLWLASMRTKAALTLTAQQLDTVSPKNPVTIMLSPQEAVVNSKALQAVIKKTPSFATMQGLLKDPKTGQATGQCRGMAFGTLFYEFQPWPNIEEAVQQEKKIMLNLAKSGATTRIGRAQGLAITILSELYTRGELPIRLRFAHEFLRLLPDAERFFRRMGNLSGIGDDWLKIYGTVALQVDGAENVGTVRTKKPKLRVMPGAMYGEYGVNYWEEAGTIPPQNMILAGKYGWNIVSLHSYGDRTAEMSLEVFAEAMKQHPSGLTKRRWVFDHNYMHDNETIQEMKRLNVIPSVLLWFRGSRGERRPSEELGKPFNIQVDPLVYMYGADSLNQWSRARSLIEAGIKPAAETSGAALASIEGFVTRKDAKGRVWGPQERIARQEALWMKTRWAAYISEDEDKLGSIEVGKLADFVVLGGDYMTVPEDEISEIPVLMTVVGGKVVYEEPGKL